MVRPERLYVGRLTLVSNKKKKIGKYKLFKHSAILGEEKTHVRCTISGGSHVVWIICILSNQIDPPTCPFIVSNYANQTDVLSVTLKFLNSKLLLNDFNKIGGFVLVSNATNC